MLCDTAHDGTVLQSVGNFELQQFLALLHLFAAEDRTHADVQLFKLFKGNVGQHRLRLVVSRLVGLLRVEQFLHLRLDDAVVNFLEEQFRLSQLFPCGQQVNAAESVPFGGLHTQHTAQSFGAEG